MAEVTANGVRFHVQRLKAREAGIRRGETVVFLHGLVVDDLSSFFYTLASPVASTGAEVILYDLRGHGLSERTRSGYSITDSVADLAELLDVLEVRGPVHLVGNSYGGTVALSYALANRERVESLVLIEALVPVEGWGERMAATLAKRASDLKAGELHPRLGRHFRGRSRRAARAEALITDTTLLADLRPAKPMSMGELSALRCPARAFYGGESDALDDAGRLERSLPDLGLTILPGCSHWVLSQAPSFLRKGVLEWFRAQPALPASALEGVAGP